MNKNNHKGHRERLKRRYTESGMGIFNPHELLELLLFYAIPLKDTNEIAHELISRFGSLSGVMDADTEELCKCKGVGMHTAALLKLIPGMTKAYIQDKNKKLTELNNCIKAGTYALSLFVDEVNEAFYVICLNSGNGVLGKEKVGHGSINNSTVYEREVAEVALRYNAVKVIFAHNHPGGTLSPSAADFEVTEKLSNMLSSLRITTADHIIVAKGEYYSMASHGLI